MTWYYKGGENKEEGDFYNSKVLHDLEKSYNVQKLKNI